MKPWKIQLFAVDPFLGILKFHHRVRWSESSHDVVEITDWFWQPFSVKLFELGSSPKFGWIFCAQSIEKYCIMQPPCFRGGYTIYPTKDSKWIPRIFETGSMGWTQLTHLFTTLPNSANSTADIPLDPRSLRLLMKSLEMDMENLKNNNKQLVFKKNKKHQKTTFTVGHFRIQGSISCFFKKNTPQKSLTNTSPEIQGDASFWNLSFSPFVQLWVFLMLHGTKGIFCLHIYMYHKNQPFM